MDKATRANKNAGQRSNAPHQRTTWSLRHLSGRRRTTRRGAHVCVDLITHTHKHTHTHTQPDFAHFLLLSLFKELFQHGLRRGYIGPWMARVDRSRDAHLRGGQLRDAQTRDPRAHVM